MTDQRNTTKGNGRRRGARALLAGLAALTAAAMALAPAASADRQDGEGEGDLAHVASYLRQDLETVVKKGKLRAGCILVERNDKDRPVECTITATYKGELVDSYSRTIERPFAGWETDLQVSDRIGRKLARADQRISYIKLRLEAEDAAGNVGSDVERISVIRGLYD